MPIRISQHQIYSHSLNGMNKNLSDLMALHEQNVTQKRVNRPADDPYGSAQIFAAKNTLASITQYTDNLNMAKAWLDQTDGVLSLVDTELVELQTILMQGATGTLNKDQRQNLAFKARAIMDQLINYSNTEINGRSIFAGHKTDTNAFELGLAVTCNDQFDPDIPGKLGMEDVQFKVSGGSASTVIVQFTEDAEFSGTPPALLTNTLTPPTFRYSSDAGATWYVGEWDSAGKTMRAGGVKIEPIFDPVDPSNPHGKVNTVEPSIPTGATPDLPTAGPTNQHEGNNGTWLYIRPAAVYQGDTNDEVRVQSYRNNSSSTPIDITGTAKGYFTRDVVVRIDNTTPPTTPTPPAPATPLVSGTIEYSYSLDNGDSWVSSSTPYDNTTVTKLAVPGGILTLKATTPLQLYNNDQFVIKPYRADIELNIGFNASIVVNNVGKDIFGGIYDVPFSNNGAQPVNGRTQPVSPDMNGYGKNLFELCGEAIAYFESNGQQGCQKILDELQVAMEHVVGYRTKTGARMNRVESVENQLEFLKYDEEGRLSTLEDVDLSELLSKLSQQQIAYNSVLKSSSMIMQMSLLNFI